MGSGWSYGRSARKSRSLDAAARGGNISTTDPRRSPLTNKTQSSSNHRAQAGGHREQDQTEEKEEQQQQQEQEEQQQQGYDAKQSLPNIAAHFAGLTKAVLNRRRFDVEATERMYEEFVQRSKRKLISELKDIYNTLLSVYNDQCMPLPAWLSESSAEKEFYTPSMDRRLDDKALQIKQDLLAFVEEKGFVCSHVTYMNFTKYKFDSWFKVNLQLDVSSVPTTEATEKLKKRLLTLDNIFYV